jgi:cell wall-associated NlpC family hydrolase
MKKLALKKYKKILKNVGISLLLVLGIGITSANLLGVGAFEGKSFAEAWGYESTWNGDDAVTLARKLMSTYSNINYHYGGKTFRNYTVDKSTNQPDNLTANGYYGLDCSGFVTYVYQKMIYGSGVWIDDNGLVKYNTSTTPYANDGTGWNTSDGNGINQIYGMRAEDWASALDAKGVSSSAVQELGTYNAEALSEFQPGDYVYFLPAPKYNTAGVLIGYYSAHCGIYTGNGNIIHISVSNNKIVEESITNVHANDGEKSVTGYKIYHMSPEQDLTATITKTDADTNSSTAQGDATLAGAEYTLYDETGTAVHTFVIKADGTSDTAEGISKKKTYTLKETKAPTGYALDSTVINWAIDSNAKYTVSKNVSDSVLTGKVALQKYKSNTDASTNSPETCQAEQGAVFEVIAKKYVDQCGSIEKALEAYKNGQLKTTAKEYAKITTDANGYGISGDLAYGTYMMKQTVAASNMRLDTEVRTINITGDNVGKTQTYTIYNDNITENQVQKLDADGGEVEGASMQVIDSNGNVVVSWTSTKEPYIIRDLDPGSYILHEDLAPAGYVMANDIPFVITNTSEVQTISMVDKKVTISKVDVGGEEIPGASMQITDEEGNVVDEWISTTEPHQASGLESGKSYVLHEVAAANGYVVASDIPFTVDADNLDQHITMTDQRVGITKKDGEFGYGLVEGAKLELVDADGNVVDSWYTDGDVHYASNVVAGQTYTLREAYTPDGFVKANDVTFTIEENGSNMEVEMTDPVMYIHKVDDFNKQVSGAKINVIDTEGNIVDEWTTYGKLVTLTEEQQATLAAGETVYLEQSAVITDEQQQQVLALQDQLRELVATMQSEDRDMTVDYLSQANLLLTNIVEQADTNFAGTGTNVNETFDAQAGLAIQDSLNDMASILTNVSNNTLQESDVASLTKDLTAISDAITTMNVKSDNSLVNASLPSQFATCSNTITTLAKVGEINASDLATMKTTVGKIWNYLNAAFFGNTGDVHMEAGVVFISDTLDSNVISWASSSDAAIQSATDGITDYTENLQVLFKQLNNAATEDKSAKADAIIAELNKLVDKFNAACVTYSGGDVTSSKIVPVQTDSGYVYDLIQVTGTEEDKTTSYHRIDINGYEYAHRVSGLVADGEYTVHEVESPSGYALAVDMMFTAGTDTSMTISMIDNIVLLGSGTTNGVNTGVQVKLIHVIYAGIAVLILLVLAIVRFFIKKHKKNKDVIKLV